MSSWSIFKGFVLNSGNGRVNKVILNFVNANFHDIQIVEVMTENTAVKYI